MKRERLGRIDHELQRELARLISTQLKDPRLGFITVTRVEATNDLRTAKVFVSIIGDRHVAKQSMLALESARGFLRGELGHAVELRHTPELVFVEDRTTEKAIALGKVLTEAPRSGAPSNEAPRSGARSSEAPRSGEPPAETSNHAALAAAGGSPATAGGTDDPE